MKQATPALVRLLFFSALLSAQTFASAYSAPTYRVGTAFAVEVSSQEDVRFAGVRVVLVRANRVSSAPLTDERGVAHFQNVTIGDYSLELDQLGASGGKTADLIVVGTAGVQNIQMGWPSARILRTRRVKGTLLNSNTGQAVRETSLQLVHGLTGVLEARLVTDKAGHFNLGASKSGFHFIKVESLYSADSEPRGDIAVLVGRESVRDLLLVVGETSRGMFYSEVCVASPSAVSLLRAGVSDEMGAVIDRGNVELIPKLRDHESARRIQLDRSGHFKVESLEPYQYRLRIRSSGFTPFIIPVTLDPNSSANGTLQVQLSVLGSVCNNNADRHKDSAN